MKVVFAIAGFADTQPLVPNETKENRAKNRRVEIVLQEKTDQEVKQEVIDARDIYQQSTPEEKKRIFELDPAEIF